MKSLKQRAAELLRKGAGEVTIFMAFDLLQELVDESEPDPKYYGWLRAVDEALVIHHLGTACIADDYETAKRKLQALLSLNQDIGEYLSAKAPAPSVPDGWRAALVKEFPLYDEDGIDEDKHCCEWVMLQERKRLHKILAALTPAEPPDDVAQNAGELERLRMQLAACTTAALLNTRETMAERITADNPYYSAAYADVCRAVDREVEYREKLADVARDAERLNWLDKQNTPHGLGWEVIQMPAGNVHIHTVVGEKAEFKSIREAIDAAIERQGDES